MSTKEKNKLYKKRIKKEKKRNQKVNINIYNYVIRKKTVSTMSCRDNPEETDCPAENYFTSGLVQLQQAIDDLIISRR